jgi:hypothetical protein
MQNEIDRKYCYCPIMREVCCGGHTKSMGEDEKTGEQFKCRWWVHVAGKDPQSDKSVDWFDCSVSWLPVLQIETSQMVRQSTFSIDKTANVFFSALNESVQQKILLKNNEQKLLNEK